MTELAIALQIMFNAAGLAPLPRADHDRVAKAAEVIQKQCVIPAEAKAKKDKK